MGILNFLKRDRNKKIAVTTSIGEFYFLETNGTKNYQGKVKSKINDDIELLFPINDDNISEYQINYFKKIENSWISILQQASTQKPNINFKDYKVVSILIPDKGNKFYDVDVEIVVQKGEEIFSLILSDLNVNEIIEV